MDFSLLSEAIAPNGDYSSASSSGATGKYGFSWLYHGNDIKKITGVKDKNEFLNSPEAQEKYFKWHIDTNVLPAIGRIKGGDGTFTDADIELAKIVHLRGEGGAKKYIKNHPEIIKMPVAEDEIVDISQPTHPVSNEERQAWEKMQTAAHQTGFLGDDHNKAPGVEFMQNQGFNPKRLSAIQQDFLDKKGGNSVRAGEDGFSPVDDFYGHKTAKQRYTNYETIHTDRYGNTVPEDTKKYGVAFDQFQKDQQAKHDATLSEFSGMNVPENNINYRPPVEEAVVVPKPTTDPNFPTIDPATGRVIPALNKQIKDAAIGLSVSPVDAALNISEDENKPSKIRRLINGIFGNDNEGKPVRYGR